MVLAFLYNFYISTLTVCQKNIFCFNFIRRVMCWIFWIKLLPQLILFFQRLKTHRPFINFHKITFTCRVKGTEKTQLDFRILSKKHGFDLNVLLLLKVVTSTSKLLQITILRFNVPLLQSCNSTNTTLSRTSFQPIYSC